MQQTGWKQFADDAVVLNLDSDRVRACPLGFTPGLRPASRAQFANLSNPSPASPWPTAETRLIAVFLLQQNTRLPGPRISLIPGARAFSELLVHAHCFDAEDPAHKRRLVNDYLGITARVPTFALEYPPNFQQLGELTSTVVETATSINPSAGG
jgi:hypothetical protein